MRALLANGADPNARTYKAMPLLSRFIQQQTGLEVTTLGATPFWWAASYGDLPTMQMLIEWGADPWINTVGRHDAADGRRRRRLRRRPGQVRPPLVRARYDVAAGAGDAPRCSTASISASTSTRRTTRDRRRSTARVYFGGTMLAPFLVEHGANINAINKRGQTPWLITQGEYQAGSFIEHKETGDVLERLGADTTLGKDLGADGMPRRLQNADDADRGEDSLFGLSRPGRSSAVASARGRRRRRRRRARRGCDEIAANAGARWRGTVRRATASGCTAADVVLAGHRPRRSSAQSAQTLEKVVRKLRSGTMPPPGAPRPDPTTVGRACVASLETSLDRGAAAHPNPGRLPALAPAESRRIRQRHPRPARRATIDATSLLPPDDSGYGFDNIADVLSVSPMLTERYLSAAQKISRLAVGDPSAAADDRHLRGQQVPAAGRSRQRGSAVRLARRPGDSLLLPGRRRLHRQDVPRSHLRRPGPRTRRRARARSAAERREGADSSRSAKPPASADAAAGRRRARARRARRQSTARK